jgi:MYXO-CTERM domain-containing protein
MRRLEAVRGQRLRALWVALVAACSAPGPSPESAAVALEVGAERELDPPVIGPAPGPQLGTMVVSRGDGYLVLWWDQRASLRLYAARIGADGAVLDPTGIPLTAARTGSFEVAAACDPDSRCLIVGEGVGELVFIRLDGDRVLDDPPRQLVTGWSVYVPSVAWAGSTFLVAWTHSEQGLYAAHVGIDGAVGAVMELAAHVPDATYAFRPAVACERPRCLVAWQSVERTTGPSEIRGRLVDASGPVGVAATLDRGPGGDGAPAATWDGARYWVAFLEGGAVAAVRVGAAGEVVDDQNIVVAAPAAGRQRPRIGHDGTSAVVLWDQSGLASVVAARIADDGAVLDPVPVVVAPNGRFARDGDLACRTGGCLAIWEDSGWGPVLRATRFAGGVPLDLDGLAPATSPAAQIDPAIAWGPGGYLAVWRDSRPETGVRWNPALRGARFSRAMEPVPIEIRRDPCPSYAICVSMVTPAIAAAADGYLVAWGEQQDEEAGQIFGRVLGADGAPRAGVRVLSIGDGLHTQPSLAAAPDQYLMTWEYQPATYNEYEPLGPTVLRARRFDPTAAALDPAPIALAMGGSLPIAAWNGTSFLVVWQRAGAGPGTRQDLVAARVSTTGAVLDGEPIVVADRAERGEDAASVACGGGVCLVTWRSGPLEVRAGRFLPDGTALDPGGLLVASVYGVVEATATTFDGDRFTVAWRTAGGALHGAEVTVDGAVVDGSEVVLAAAPWPLDRPVLASDGAGHRALVYDVLDTTAAYRVRRVRARAITEDAPIDAGVPDAGIDGGLAVDGAVADAAAYDAPGGPGDPGGDDGCGCRAGAASGALPWLVLIAVGALRWSRRREGALIAAALLVACGDDDGTPMDAAPVDAAVDAAPVDAAPVDAAVDAAPADAAVDAAPAFASVHVVVGEQPAADVVVLVHDRDGALIGRARTDAAGDATVMIGDGSMVTVVERDQTPRLRTVRDVEPGDQLVFATRQRFSGATWGTVTMPTYRQAPNPHTYSASLDCLGGSTLPGEAPRITVSHRCASSSPSSSLMAVVAGSLPPGIYDPVAYIEMRDVSLAPPGSPIAVAGPWLPALTQQIAIAGMPAGADFRWGKEYYRGGVPFFGMSGAGQGPSHVPGGGDAWRVRFTLCRSLFDACQVWWRWLADPLVIEQDFAALRLPWVETTAVELGLRTRVSWTTDRVQAYTATRVRVQQRDFTVLMAEWETFLPAQETASPAIVLPDLPADLVDLWVDLSPGVPDNRVVVGLDQVELPFDDVRQRAFSEDYLLAFPPPIQALTMTSQSRDWSTSGP